MEWAGLACDVRLRCCDKDEDEDTDEGAGTGKDGWLVAEAVAVALGLAAAPSERVVPPDGRLPAAFLDADDEVEHAFLDDADDDEVEPAFLDDADDDEVEPAFLNDEEADEAEAEEEEEGRLEPPNSSAISF